MRIEVGRSVSQMVPCGAGTLPAGPPSRIYSARVAAILSHAVKWSNRILLADHYWRTQSAYCLRVITRLRLTAYWVRRACMNRIVTWRGISRPVCSFQDIQIRTHVSCDLENG